MTGTGAESASLRPRLWQIAPHGEGLQLQLGRHADGVVRIKPDDVDREFHAVQAGHPIACPADEGIKVCDPCICIYRHGLEIRGSCAGPELLAIVRWRDRDGGTTRDRGGPQLLLIGSNRLNFLNL